MRGGHSTPDKREDALYGLLTGGLQTFDERRDLTKSAAVVELHGPEVDSDVQPSAPRSDHPSR